MELNAKDKTIKSLQDKIGENLDDFGFDNDFFRSDAKRLSMKEKFDKCNFIKIIKNNFCSEKDTVKRMKRQAKENIFKTHI